MSKGQIFIDLYHHLYEKSKLRSFFGGKTGHKMTFVTLTSDINEYECIKQPGAKLQFFGENV